MSKEEIINKIIRVLKRHDNIVLGILYGSIARKEDDFDSDLDLGVAGAKPITVSQKQQLIEEFASEIGRPVDLADLQATHGTLLQQILSKGEKIYCTDDLIYAEIIKRMLFNQADMMPYYYRILKERRERWIEE